MIRQQSPSLHQWLLRQRRWFALLSIATGFFILYRPLLDAGWRYDDGHHLLFANRYSPWEYFFVPEIARLQSGAHFTPFNVLVYELCLNFGSGRPGLGYAFHLGLIGLITGLLWRYLSTLHDQRAAWAGSLLFITGFPVIGVSHQLMTGHYLIGAVFFLIFLIRYETYSRHQKRPDWILCAAYFLACLSKEVYIVAPALLLFDHRLCKRIPHLIALSATLAFFWTIRTWVIQRVIGGYSNQLRLGQLGDSAGILLSGIINRALEFRIGYALVVLIAFALLIAFIQFQRNHGWPKSISTGAVLTLACFAPLLPVAYNLTPGHHSEIRLLFFSWLVLSVVIGGLAARTQSHSIWVAAACVSVSFAYSLLYVKDSGLIKESRRFDIFSDYVLARPDCHLIDSYGWSSWAAELAQGRNAPLGAWMVASEPVLHALAKAGTPICSGDKGKLRVTGVVDPKHIHIDEQSQFAISIDYTGSHATVHLESEIHGSLVFYKANQFLLYIAPELMYPLPDPTRFNNFRPLLISDDGNSVVIGPELNFSPLVPGTWRWERRVKVNPEA